MYIYIYTHTSVCIYIYMHVYYVYIYTYTPIISVAVDLPNKVDNGLLLNSKGALKNLIEGALIIAYI